MPAVGDESRELGANVRASQELWPRIGALQGIGEQNAEAAIGCGYRQEGDEKESTTLEVRLAQKVIREGHLANSGSPSWEPRSRVFNRVLARNGVGAYVF
jgi:hypothetical protein